MRKNELYNQILHINSLNQPLKDIEIKKISLRKDYDIRNLVLPVDQTINIGKNVWEVCAKVLVEKENMELIVVIDGLLEWIQDLNWPGSEYILRRICDFQNKDILPRIEESIKQADKLQDIDWKRSLNLAKNKILYNEEIDRIWI